MLPGSAVSLFETNFHLRIQFAIHPSRFLQHEVYPIIYSRSVHRMSFYCIELKS